MGYCQVLKTYNIVSPDSSFRSYAPGPINFRIRCSGSLNSNKPLFVLDGILIQLNDLKDFNPDEIESISILKDSAAAALYGCRAASGVVIITTKHANERSLVIKDVLNGNPIAGASVEIISKSNQDTIRLIADSEGAIITNKIIYGNEYELRVSSIGYKNFQLPVNSKQIGKIFQVLMERNFIIPGEVTLLCKTGGRTIHCGFSIVNINSFNTEILSEKLSDFKIYPNPVQRTQYSNIIYNSVATGKVSFRLLSMNGDLVSQMNYKSVAGTNKFSFRFDNKMSAGVYLIQAIDETNKVIKSEKIIIQ